ncbi:hypothetical protein BJX61DRAFT_488209 [Aspergillus egyptiacus]|nr:hypothetical protein BJX61DRAFT_488209 [Aspergillus egyptiacus]
MGNICSSSKNESDPSTRPGRVLGSNTTTTTTAPRASVPASAKPNKSPFQSPGRTLGGGSETEPAAESPRDTADARAKAADAAQVCFVTLCVRSDSARVRANVGQKRAEAAGPKGKLGSKLAAQKAQTQAQTLSEVSREERAARDADGAEAARRWE